MDKGELSLTGKLPQTQKPCQKMALMSVMTNLTGNLKKILGYLYGLRTWVEYAFRQCKQELGWRDYRFTQFKEIEKWWEIIFCVYTMISLNSPAFLYLNQSPEMANNSTDIDDVQVSNHQQWNHEGG